jgi:DNA-binding transcriptional regulator YiaG
MPPRGKTSAEEVKAFRRKYGLTQGALDRLLGFTSEGAAVRRWERQNAPHYVCLLFALVADNGIDLMREMAAKGVERTPREAVQAFRERHKLSAEALDRLFGFASLGRTTRRWEDPLERGAPTYVTLLMAYADKFGLTKLEELARKCD